jgi:hypothetical protein
MGSFEESQTKRLGFVAVGNSLEVLALGNYLGFVSYSCPKDC